MKNNYRETIVKVLPFMQFAIALYTLAQISTLEPRNPQYFCTQPDPYTALLICNPQ